MPQAGLYPRVRPRSVSLQSEGPFIPRKGEATAAQAAGNRHERRMHYYLEKKFPRDYLASPWITYTTSFAGGWKWCQPDGLLFMWDKGLIIVVEGKIKHTEKSYWQTENLYVPVVSVLFPLWEYAVCEVVRWYDPSVRFPVQPKIVEGITDCRPGDFNVFIMRGHHLEGA